MAVLREVEPGVLVATSRIMSTNSTVIVGGGEALLVDPAWLPVELDALAQELRARTLSVIGGFATHAHHDHLLWHPTWEQSPRWASSRTAELARSERDALVGSLGPEFSADDRDLMGRVIGVPDAIPRQSIPEAVTIELLVHDGHAPGHTALWLPEKRVLVSGDMLSDTELPLPFWPDDLPAYVDALDRLAPIVAAASHIIPGHGTLGTNALERLDADRRYIDDMLATGSSDDPRIQLPGMADVHERMRNLVSEQ